LLITSSIFYVDYIKAAINQRRKAGPLGSLELKIASWSSQEDHLLNALYQEVAWTSNQSDASRYAVSAEVHAWRFAASASAGVSNWKPGDGLLHLALSENSYLSLGWFL
jgi:hypothetical protein